MTKRRRMIGAIKKRTIVQSVHEARWEILKRKKTLFEKTIVLLAE